MTGRGRRKTANQRQTGSELEESEEEGDATITPTNSDTILLESNMIQRFFKELSEIKQLLREIRDQGTTARNAETDTPTSEPTQETRVNITDALTSVTRALENINRTPTPEQTERPTMQNEAWRVKSSITQTSLNPQ